MKIFITGGSGFIGRNLKEQLGDKYQVAAPASSELICCSGCLAPTATHGTGCHADKLAEHGLLGLAQLPASATAGTDIGLFCLAARSPACSTGLAVQDLDLLVGARHCLFERDLHTHQEIGAGLRARPALAPTKKVEDIPKPEKFEENPPPP